MTIRRCRCREARTTLSRVTSKLTLNSPLRPEELQVLRAQYEKEGEFVGVQTKFNYAWVCRGIIVCDGVSYSV